MGKTTLETLQGGYYLIACLSTLCSSVSQQCLSYLQNNACQGPSRPAGTQHCGLSPFEDMEVDFTEITPSRGFRYFLVFICTFSGWVESLSYPNWKSKTSNQGTPERHCPQIWNTSDHMVGQWTSTCRGCRTTGGKSFVNPVEISYYLPSPELRESGTCESNPQTN